MSLYAWIPLVAAVASCWLLLNRWAFRDLMSPFNLLLPCWIFPLLLTMLHLSYKERPWSTETLLMIGWTTIAMATVSFGASQFLGRRREIWPPSSFGVMVNFLRRRSVTVALLLWYLFGITATIYNEFITNPIGIPVLTYLRTPDISREPYWQWKGSLWMLSIPAFTLTPVFYLKFKIETRRLPKLMFLAIAFSYPLLEILKLSRSECIYGLSTILLVHYYYQKRTGGPSRKLRRPLSGFFRTLGIAAVVVLLALGSATLFQQLRGNRPMAKSSRGLQIKTDLPEPYASTVDEIYGYFALPFENFSNLVNNYHGGTNLGVGVLRPLYSIVGLGRIPREEIESIDFDQYFLMLPVNTYPFLSSIYAESGWAGILIAPLLYAIGINFLYLVFRLRPTIEMLVLYTTMVSYCWLWVFSNQNFTGVQYYLYALAIYPIMQSIAIFRAPRQLRTRTALGEKTAETTPSNPA